MALGRCRASLLVLCCTLAAACGAGSVVRVANGRVEAGRFIPEESYASFLAGALAEASGDLRAALKDYDAAASDGGDDPELWTRRGSVRCRMAPGDPLADKDFARALEMTPSYPPALAAREACAALGRAASPSTQRSSAPREDERRRLLAVALLDAGAASGWEAVAAAGHAEGDGALQVLGLAGVARTAPERHAALQGIVVELAGSGYVGSARALAAVLLGRPGEGSATGLESKAAPLVARLGIDEALLSADRGAIVARSVRADLPLEVVAARAWAFGELRLAADLVSLPRVADPNNLAAALVYEGALGRSASRLLPRERGGRLLAPEVVLPVARDLLNREGIAAATRALSWCDLTATSGDALLEPLTVEMALAGAATDGALPGNARIEVALRRGTTPSRELLVDRSIDARHRLLALSVLAPMDAEARSAADRLMGAAGTDRVVAVGVARIAVARHEKPPIAVRSYLESLAASDALAAASLIDVLVADGPASALEGARRHLAALAQTPAERQQSRSR